MNPPAHRPLIFALSLLCAATLAAAPSARSKPPRPGGETNSNAVHFEKIKIKIDALLKPRLNPDPLPNPLPDLFQRSEVSRPAPPKATTEGLAPSTDSEMLLYYGASLKISGTVRIDDETHLVINQAPYKEGDNLTLKTKDATVKLRILGIAPGELTLGLNEAVQVIKFKK